jgi:cell division protein FtsQ
MTLPLPPRPRPAAAPARARAAHARAAAEAAAPGRLARWRAAWRRPGPWDVRAANLAALAIGTVLLVGALAAAAQWLARSPAFTLGQIEFGGELTRHDAAALRAHALPRLHKNFFALDLAQARAVFEELPWVRRAEVQRVWPDRLRVTIEEHRAAALWEGSAEAGSAAGLERLVNTFGELFEANPGEVDADLLPVLTGPAEGVAQALALHARLQQVFAPLPAQVMRLERSARGSWRVELDNGARIELGRGDEAALAARTERFVRTLPEVTARFQAPLAAADLRHPDGYAVRLEGITTRAPAAPAAPAAARPRPRTP